MAERGTPMPQDGLARLKALAEKATPGRWWIATGCSWRRIRSKLPTGEDVAVLEPTVAHDGHPDLHDYARRDGGDNLAYIAAANPVVVKALVEEVESAAKALRMQVEDKHRYAGLCPDLEQRDSRDPMCAACKALIAHSEARAATEKALEGSGE